MTRTGVYETQLSMDAALENAGAWVELAQRVIREMEPGLEFTAENVRAIAGEPPGHADVVGAVIRGASKQGVIRHVGWTTATRPDAHGRALRTWRKV